MSRYYYDYEDQYPWNDTVSEIYSHRREGRLDEAIELARSAHESYPLEDDVNKAYGWTLCSLAKNAISNGSLDIANVLYNEYCQLSFNYEDEYVDTLCRSFAAIAKQLDPYSAQIDAAIKESKDGNPKVAAEKMLSLLEQNTLKERHAEDLGWVLYRYFNSCDPNDINTSFFVKCLKSFHAVCGTKGSMLHSSMLMALLKLASKSSFRFDGYFFIMWGPENLRYEDYRENSFEGKSYQSLFYRICNYFVERDLPFDIELFCSKTKQDPFFVANILRKCWFWKMYRESQKGKSETLWAMFSKYNEALSSYGPSEWHSQIMKLAMRCMIEQDLNRLLPFFVSWGHNFCDADWKPSVGKDGKEYPPLAGRVIKASFDSYYESGQNNADCNQFLIEAFINAIDKNPNDEWGKRNLGRLYYKSGNKPAAEAIYRKLSNVLFDKYYYWQEFSQFVDDPNVKAGMLAKALLIESNENYIGDIRLEMASMLISMGNKLEASRELESYHANRIKNSWRIADKYSALKHSIGAITNDGRDNKPLYLSLSVYADEYVYKDFPWIDVVIAEAWKTEDNKSFILLTDGKGHTFRSKRNSNMLFKSAHVGQPFQIKYDEDASKMLIVRSSNKTDWEILPEKSAYIEYINEEKCVAHIITEEDKALFFHFDKAKPFMKGSFVKVRSFEKMSKEKGMVTNVVSKRRCSREDALQAFRSKVVVVDGVNMEKKHFHFVLGCGLIGGNISFSETALRPGVGDSIKVHYCITKNKQGRKLAVAINVEETDEVAPNMVFTTVGFVEVQYNNGHQFGFINDYYVPEKLTYDSACNGKVVAKVLNIQKGKEKVFEIKPYTEEE